MYSGYLSVDVAGYIVSTQSIVGICRTAQNAHVRITGRIFELLSTDDGSLVVCSMRRLPPRVLDRSNPFLSLLVMLMHASAMTHFSLRYELGCFQEVPTQVGQPTVVKKY
jgi:hypothetical protein